MVQFVARSLTHTTLVTWTQRVLVELLQWVG
jgi:hypothetical protein